MTALGADAKTVRPMRMVAIGNAFGFYAQQFFPKATGADYDTPHLLEPIADRKSTV